MKKILKGKEPKVLIEYKKTYPDDDWKTGFKKNSGVDGKQVSAALKIDQKGLCAYCEIDLKSGGGKALDDFRVEHFSPENPPKGVITNGINYALEWTNLLGCCCGGNSKSVIDSKSRYTNPDYSCDVPKGNKYWVNDILNPLTDIPPFAKIFKFDEQSGEILLDEALCSDELKPQAEKSITLLKLNAERLTKFRLAVFEVLAEQLKDYIDDEAEDKDVAETEALCKLAMDYFNHPEENDHPAFFTTIRWYLADKAEEVLQQAGYDG